MSLRWLLRLPRVHLESHEVGAHFFVVQLLAEVEPRHEVSDFRSGCGLHIRGTQYLVFAFCSWRRIPCPEALQVGPGRVQHTEVFFPSCFAQVYLSATSSALLLRAARKSGAEVVGFINLGVEGLSACPRYMGAATYQLRVGAALRPTA